MKNKRLEQNEIKEIEKLYLQDRWSTIKIAKKFGCSYRSIVYWLKQLNIKARDYNESHIGNYKFNGDYDVLYGSLLGDACLLRRNKKTDQGMASFSKANVGYDHVLFVGTLLLNTDAKERIKENPVEVGRNKFKFTTQMCEEFLKEYKRWYPKGIKVVPKDLKLNPKILLHWFMDDGHSCWKHKNKNSVSLGLSTESFTKKDCNFLLKQMEEMGIECYLGKSHGGYGHKIYVRGHYVKKFFDLIGPCPKEVPSMAYKWKIPNLQPRQLVV